MGDKVVISIDSSNYLYQAFIESLKKRLPLIEIAKELDSLKDGKIFQYGDYEQLDFDRAMSDPKYLVCSYVYRKALIRKHYLSHTIHSYVVKHPDSILNQAFPETYMIEVDYAEFLDDALDECYELRDEVNKNEKVWILKPSMSDKGQGIRIFKTLDQLQEIFDSFEEDDDDDEDEENNGVITSQLRHFVVQKYLSSPLLLPAHNNRKFHIRSYILCSGALTVYVYKRMLALFAAEKYNKDNVDSLADTLDQLDLNEHLTNTCLQGQSAESNNSVVEFKDLKGLSDNDKEKIFGNICEIVKETFKAAVNVDRFNFQPLPNAFEFYGLDFLVDEQLNVTLLEINAYPDFKQTGELLKGLVYGLIDETVNRVVVPFFSHKEAQIEPSYLVKVLEQATSGGL